MILYFSLGDPDWVTQAACQGSDDEVFFSPEARTEGPPDAEELGWIRSEGAKRDAVAKTRYCSLCPSRGRCATEGWTEEHGIWGGWTPWEREQIRTGTYRPSPVRSAVSPRRDEAVRLIREGMTVDDTAVKMEISPQAVNDYLRQYWTVVTSYPVTESDV